MCFLSFLLWFCLFSPYVQTEEKEKPPTSEQAPKEELYETFHTITLENQAIHYKATVGSILLKNASCNPIANVFFTSYTQTDVSSSQRPITFCFNGGPGSSSVWLHIGLAGPKRVVLPQNGTFSIPPYQMVSNEFSLLDFTDLVFIDPVSTGFSQAIPHDTTANFYSTKEDIASIAQFIHIYLTKYNRWDSAKFIMGESYGTTRAVGLADFLHKKEFIDINGIILISSVLNFQSIYPDTGNDLPYLLLLPSYTATAWYHKKLPLDLQKNLEGAITAAKDFVYTTYNPALFQGNLLQEDRKKEIAEKLSSFTGLSSEYLLKSNLRVDFFHFAKELLQKNNKVLGCYDGRITGICLDPISETITYDPSMDIVTGAFTTCFNTYLQNTLGWKKEAPYQILSDAIQSWDFNASNQYLNVSENLKEVMTQNPHLQVFVASGIFDLVTPFFATEYTFHHLGLDGSLQDHITFCNYPGGHMMYTDTTTLAKMKKDLSLFYQKALPSHP